MYVAKSVVKVLTTNFFLPILISQTVCLYSLAPAILLLISIIPIN